MNKPDVYCKISRQIIEKKLNTLNVFQQPKYINFAIRLLQTDLLQVLMFMNFHQDLTAYFN